jgi:hypothetical protein
MLPYQEDAKKLEKLLEKLFEDDDESTPDDVVILDGPAGPWPIPFGNCCSYSYNNYS